MNRFVLFIFVLLCGINLPAQTIVVAASANLAAVEAPLGMAFTRAYPGMKAQFTFGASGTLVTQMLNGAPFQAFLSADQAFAQKLVDAGLAAGPVKTYARGKLILLSTSPLDPTRGLAVLLDPRVSQVAMANPETAPYGRAAIEALTKAGLYERVQPKIVMAQNITQAVQFTLSTGLGFVSQSAVLSKDLAAYGEKGKFWLEVDPVLYAPIEQGFVLLKPADQTPEGRALATFLLSPEARAVFAAFGYGSL